MNEKTVENQAVVLERFRYALHQYLSNELIEEMAQAPDVRLVQTTAQFYGSNVLMQVRGEILGRDLEKQECRYPADWWQAVKERWVPDWLKQRWPVRYRTVRLTARELYPRVAMADRDPRIIIMKR